MTIGVKNDQGKVRLGMLFSKRLLPAISSVAKVLSYGAVKYPGADNWFHVVDAISRYRDAGMRHYAAYLSGEYYDQESRLPHLAHAACNCLFLLALELAEIPIETKVNDFEDWREG